MQILFEGRKARLKRAVNLLAHIAELHSAEDFTNIGNWLSGAEKYFLQGFVDSGDCILGGLNGYDKNGLQELLKLLNVKIPSAKIRG